MLDLRRNGGSIPLRHSLELARSWLDIRVHGGYDVVVRMVWRV